MAYLLFSILHFVPTVTLKFLVYNEYGPSVLKGDNITLDVIESSHDIFLFQKKYPKMKEYFSRFDQILEMSSGELVLSLKDSIKDLIKAQGHLGKEEDTT